MVLVAGDVVLDVHPPFELLLDEVRREDALLQIAPADRSAEGPDDWYLVKPSHSRSGANMPTNMLFWGWNDPSRGYCPSGAACSETSVKPTMTQPMHKRQRDAAGLIDDLQEPHADLGNRIGGGAEGHHEKMKQIHRARKSKKGT